MRPDQEQEERERLRTIELAHGRVVIREGSRGNKHCNKRRPRGPLCTEPGCNQPWRPVCPDFRCQGARVPRAIMRSEKQDGDTRMYAGHPKLEKPKGGRRGRAHR